MRGMSERREGKLEEEEGGVHSEEDRREKRQ